MGERMLLHSIRIVALMRVGFNEGKTIPYFRFQKHLTSLDDSKSQKYV